MFVTKVEHSEKKFWRHVVAKLFTKMMGPNPLQLKTETFFK